MVTASNVTAGKRRDRMVRRTQRRATVETLLQRAQLLPATERLLLEQLWEHGLTMAQLARVHRVSEFRLRRRVRRLRQQLTNPGFLLASQFADRLPPDLLGIARHHYIEGLTLRQVAARHHTTLHHVRRAITEVESFLRLAAWGRVSG